MHGQSQEWPNEYPPFDPAVSETEICWDDPEQCYIYARDTEINHPVLNGIMDCDWKRNPKWSERHFGLGRSIFKKGTLNFMSSPCAVTTIVQLLCYKPEEENKDKSRFRFLSKISAAQARSSKRYNDLAGKLSYVMTIYLCSGYHMP